MFLGGLVGSVVMQPSYLDEVFRVWGEGRVEDAVVKMGVFLGMVVIKVDKVLYIVV